jgi:hypothetical protein
VQIPFEQFGGIATTTSRFPFAWGEEMQMPFLQLGGWELPVTGQVLVLLKRG